MALGIKARDGGEIGTDSSPTDVRAAFYLSGSFSIEAWEVTRQG